MKELNIKQELTFKEIVDEIETLKLQYEDILMSFYFEDIKEEIKFIKNTRDKIYSLKFEEWRRDKIWEYMNGFENLEVILKLK